MEYVLLDEDRMIKEYSPYESGLDRFVHPNKGSFIGLDALNKWREKGFDNKLIGDEKSSEDNNS